MNGQRVRLFVYNPNDISIYDIERLIDIGIRFDIVDGLNEDEYKMLSRGEEDGETVIHKSGV